ncbi:hypothetical protein, partial [uncultured Helicobacter sp.]|uniref:hypothetical protein n=1 Tax=uncultured Helicobacter sp. TaxID=175537 RepID=UPI0026266094
IGAIFDMSLVTYRIYSSIRGIADICDCPFIIFARNRAKCVVIIEILYISTGIIGNVFILVSCYW